MKRTITLNKNEEEHQTLHQQESSIEDSKLKEKSSFIIDKFYLAYQFSRVLYRSSLKAADQEGEAL